ncbi:zinc finger C2HC domain-containing protein 1C [Nilaparvata lugens]|uniref:zinc finger C2HC domain-containing protein 1C n=1 Tax=Nilaparvata lugens TaxID=108931 RepID=UPI00193E83D1|nr:zinc finger C2HC domain-containing protein 1C [Nilaparvata lugens]
MMAPAKEPEQMKKATPLAARTRTTDPAVRQVTKSMAKLSTTKKPEVKVTPSSNVVQSRLAAAAESKQQQQPQPRVGLRRPTPVPSNSIGSRPNSASNHVAQEPAKSRVEPKSTTPSKSAPRATPSRPAPGPVPPGLVACDNCGRNFAPDRIDAHRNICLKTSKKKRKPFDPTKQRLKGTGAESYLKKGKTATPPQVTAKKSNWRKKHEEFINNIRAAKVAQAHLAAGGKISDLPPPPPSDTSDYVQCPHCKRKFNEGAAARHIPKCANMQHNKPKPVAGAGNRMQAARKRY